MKQRVISSIIGLLILAVVMAFYHTYLFNAVIAVLSVIAILELLKATKTIRFKDFSAFAVIFSVLIAFANETAFWSRLPQIVYLLFILFFVLLLKNYGKVGFEQASMVFLIAIFVPLCFSCAVYMRNQFGDVCGRYYLLLGLLSAWLCDTGSYFYGTRFGRRKLAPVVSPNKTVEGSVGGVILTIALMLPLAWIYGQAAAAAGVPVRIDYLRLAEITPFLSLMGILGDLSMSAIKRQFGVKDYGTIMPGHGGILDRFDSVLFTLPSVYIFIQYFPVIRLS